MQRKVDEGLRKITLKQELSEKILHLKSNTIDFDEKTLHHVVEVLKPHMLEKLRTKNTKSSINWLIS